MLAGGKLHQTTEVVPSGRDEPEAIASALLGALLALLGARTPVKSALVARSAARAPTPIGVASGPIALAGRATPPSSGRATRALRVAVPARRVVGAPVLAAPAARRATSPATARRAKRAKQGGTVRSPLSQATRATAVPVGARPKPGEPAAPLQRKPQDSASRARRRVGRAFVTNTEDAPSVVEAGVTTLPHLDSAAALPKAHEGIGAAPRRACAACQASGASARGKLVRRSASACGKRLRPPSPSGRPRTAQATLMA